jgi:predicted small lipoprotein YifL
MIYKHVFLGLIATAALMSATGCGKQASTTTPPVEKTTSVQTPAEKPQIVDTTPKTPAAVPVATSNPEPLPVATPAPAPNPLAATPPPATPAVESKPTTVPPSTLQTSFQAQKLAVSQAVTNQVQAVPTAATNQVLGALGLTNSVSGAVTNQVEALLEKAKVLSNNQKYQEALTTVTQLYNTKLTPEQRQKADDLKAQIQASLAQKASTEANSVLGGFLGGKK